MKYQVITLNGKPAIVESADMDGETLKFWADYAPFSSQDLAKLCCERLNGNKAPKQFFSWSKNDTNPSNLNRNNI